MEVFNFLSKVIFFLKRPKIVLVAGEGRQLAKKAIEIVLRKHFRLGGNVLVLDVDLIPSEMEKIKFFINNSSLPILVATRTSDIPADKDVFPGDKEKIPNMKKIAKLLPSKTVLVLNCDDEAIRTIKDETDLRTITFGFGRELDLFASDLMISDDSLNFKINHKGNIVPVWLENVSGKEHIYSALAAAAVGEVLDLNLVEISEALKNYRVCHITPKEGSNKFIENPS